MGRSVIMIYFVISSKSVLFMLHWSLSQIRTSPSKPHMELERHHPNTVRRGGKAKWGQMRVLWGEERWGVVMRRGGWCDVRYVNDRESRLGKGRFIIYEMGGTPHANQIFRPPPWRLVQKNSPPWRLVQNCSPPLRCVQNVSPPCGAPPIS